MFKIVVLIILDELNEEQGFRLPKNDIEIIVEINIVSYH